MWFNLICFWFFFSDIIKCIFSITKRTFHAITYKGRASDVTRLPFAILSHVWVSNSWSQALFDIEIHYIDQEILICLWPIEIQILTSTYSYGKNSYLSAGTIDITLAIEIRAESTEVQASALARRKWFFFVCQFTLIYRSLWHGNTLPSLTKDKI